jgi:hypothetical protein
MIDVTCPGHQQEFPMTVEVFYNPSRLSGSDWLESAVAGHADAHVVDVAEGVNQVPGSVMAEVTGPYTIRSITRDGIPIVDERLSGYPTGTTGTIGFLPHSQTMLVISTPADSGGGDTISYAAIAATLRFGP